ncbi:MAG: hypothetical protein BBJ57_13605 [Desulfobacterales bacterium PC51MH44]|nr:MAG: hypothetical protein BBJ57_13605 [Desulfobacterales bacterium PC51MH44]
MKIHVVGGTKFDSQLGVNILTSHKLASSPIAISSTPYQQTQMQSNDVLRLEKIIYSKLSKYNEDMFMIFCNSLSFAVDWNRISKHVNCNFLNLTSVYELLACNYSKIAVLAANNITLHRICKFLTKLSPGISIIGFSMLPLVEWVEKRDSRVEKVLNNLMQLSIELGAEAFVLGCTHFEFYSFKNETIKIIYPGKILVDQLLKFLQENSEEE